MNIIIAVVVLYFGLSWVLPNFIGALSFLNRSKTPAMTENVASNPTLAPPVLDIPFEATNSALISIIGYATPNTKVNIYLDDELKTSTQTDSTGNFNTDTIALNLGSNNIYGKTVDSKNTESLPSKTIVLTYSNDKPKLVIDTPNDNQTIHGGDKKVEVSGDTDPNASISVNGSTVVVNQDNHFDTYVSINDGDNNIVITATNSVGNTAQVTRKVTYSGS